MLCNRILTLLTDFGCEDVYVGVMKGAIASINPDLNVIDLTHKVPPQNLLAARFCLLDAVAYFPLGTVHVAVVDPGVGSNRRGIAIEWERGFLVGPDNGIFSGILSLYPAIAAVELTNSYYWRIKKTSSTFHGRDIFASVGAHLASGISLEQLGDSIDFNSLKQLPIQEFYHQKAKINSQKYIGCIQYIDHFGNLITNIPANTIIKQPRSLKVNNLIIPWGNTYSDVRQGEAIALIGSHSWLEIATNGGSAKERLSLNWGDRIEIELMEID